jgi:diadenosine tetraphosphate (Ap4A) HIT family hydrolase
MAGLDPAISFRMVPRQKAASAAGRDTRTPHARRQIMPVSGLPPYDDDNIFARILRGEIPSKKVFENDWAFAFQDINPLAPTHILIIPKGKYCSLADFSAQASEAEIAGFMRAVGEVARQLGLEAPGYRMLTNMGEDAGQEVPHFHVHLFGGRPLGRMLSRA